MIMDDLMEHLKYVSSNKNLRLKVLGFYIQLLIRAEGNLVEIESSELMDICGGISTTELRRLKDALVALELVAYKKGSRHTKSQYTLNLQSELKLHQPEQVVSIQEVDQKIEKVEVRKKAPTSTEIPPEYC